MRNASQWFIPTDSGIEIELSEFFRKYLGGQIRDVGSCG